MKTFEPINNLCLDCAAMIDPKADRHEIAFDKEGNCRRRCEKCINRFKRETAFMVTDPELLA